MCVRHTEAVLQPFGIQCAARRTRHRAISLFTCLRSASTLGGPFSVILEVRGLIFGHFGGPGGSFWRPGGSFGPLGLKFGNSDQKRLEK